jgi:hypothetical protein
MLKSKLFAATLIVFFLTNSVFAAEVLKVKGDAILIDTAGEDIRMGSTYYLMSGTKKKGIVKIVKLRPGQALAKLLKGTALPRWVLQKRSGTKSRKQVAKKRKPKAPAPKSMYSKKKRQQNRKSSNQSKLAIGFAVGMNQNSSEVLFNNPERTDKYSGSSTSFELLADYQLFNKFNLRGSLGMQNFSAGEDPNNTNCVNSAGETGQVCLVDLGYMNLDIWLRYQAFSFGRFDFWGGAGLGILFSPKYNATTALKEEDLATTTFMQIGGGADIKLTEKLYAPLWAEYGLFPSSDTVKMSSVSFYFGLAYRL